jgi:NADH-quinone oxidoreductase subunit K
MALSELHLLSAALFSIGVVVVIVKRNAILVLMGIELMLNAANVNLIAGEGVLMEGQLFAVFVILVAVCEAAVGMAIILRVYHYYSSSELDVASVLREKF